MKRYTFTRAYALMSATAVLAMATAAGWSQSLTWLGTLPDGGNSYAYGVSADGSVVVGFAYNDIAWQRAFRWTQATGMQDLGTLGGDASEAYGVSADGSVVVGSAHNDNGRWRAFRWENGVMQDLGTLGGNSSAASAVSANGSVVVGSSDYGPFRWTQATGMQPLGVGTHYGVSADGSVVVGMISVGYQYHACRWIVTTNGIDFEDLNTTYASLLTDGSYLEAAHAISPDGRYIVGYGYNAATGRNEAFLLDTGAPPQQEGDVNGDGCVDDSDLLAVLFAFGNSGGAEDLNNDGIVDDADLLTVLFNFGGGC